jgi:hypothetical protein
MSVKSLKQIFTVMMTQKIWEFSDEDFERMWQIFKDTNREWLQQYLHDFPNQFPRNRPKYQIENDFIKQRIKELEQ